MPTAKKSTKTTKTTTVEKPPTVADSLVPENVSTKPKSGNKGLVIGIIIAIIVLLCGGCAAVTGIFGLSIIDEVKKEASRLGDDPLVDVTEDGDSGDELNEVEATEGLDAANTFAQEKDDTAVLVQVGDYQGDNLLFYDYSTDKTTSNLSGKANRWLYVYMTSPDKVKVEESNSFYGKYKPTTDQGFIVQYDTKDGTTLFQDSLYSSTSFHSLDDISTMLGKMSGTEAFNTVVEHFADKIAGFGYTSMDIKGVDIAFQTIGYTDYISDDVELRGVWLVEITYNDEALTGGERSFSARVNSADGVVDSDYVYPEK